MSKIPIGVPPVTYVHIKGLQDADDEDSLSHNMNVNYDHDTSDILRDGNSVVLHHSDQGDSKNIRYEVSRLLDKGITDEDVCECTIGSRAGGGIGAAVSLNIMQKDLNEKLGSQLAFT